MKPFYGGTAVGAGKPYLIYSIGIREIRFD